MTVAVEDHSRRIHLRIQGSERGDSINRGRAVRGREPLRRAVPYLRREQAEPDLPNVGLEGPGAGKISQVVHAR